MARLYIKTPWSYETDSWFDVTSVNFNSQKVREDKIFERQDILQFLSVVWCDVQKKVLTDTAGQINYSNSA